MGRHTREFQHQWAARYPDVELQLIRTNSATGGLAEGLCDLAVLRTGVDGHRFASAIVGHERRYCAIAADDPWARRRSMTAVDLLSHRSGLPRHEMVWTHLRHRALPEDP
jgi:DNA-binding transcriptional LysR family regulator